MAVTTQQVIAASEVLTELTQQMLIIHFRSLDLYRNHARIFYSMVPTRLSAASGTVKGKILNAVMNAIDELGSGQVEIRGDESAVWWNQEKERLALVKDAFLVIFDDIVDVAPDGTIDFINPSAGVYGLAATGQRPNYCGTCGYYKTCSGDRSNYLTNFYGCMCGSSRRLAGYGYS